MAEIKVEKKKPVWPWILLIIIILGILFYLLVYDDYNEEIDDFENVDDIEENETSIYENILKPVSDRQVEA